MIFANEAHASRLTSVLPAPYVCVLRRRDLAATTSGGAITFTDVDLLEQIAGDSITGPIVGILDAKPADLLAETIHWLTKFPWLSHVVSSAMLASPRAPTHLRLLIQRFAAGLQHGMLGTTGIGRSALLARASRREQRFERMREFFARNAVSPRVVSALIDVGEELVMNALYDAPAEAGYFKTPKRRDEDVELPTDRACEISYGVEDDVAFVRVRDPFGAFTRQRMLDVLSRCNANDVKLDETRGGAGLGLWRVFSAATTIAISVIPQSLTEVLVGISLQDGRKAPKPVAVHLFFDKPNSDVPVVFPDDDEGLVDQSFTLVNVA